MSLDPCPSSPNCICSQSEAADTQHYMAPVSYSGTVEHALDVIAEVIEGSRGASVKHRSEHQIDAVFVTRILRFKDDVSFLVDGDAQMLHFRSASRVGHSDLGANRKRLDALLPQIKARL